MAGVADTAKLIASLTLDTKGFMSGVTKATGGLGKLETSLGKIGGIAGQGLKNAGVNLAKIGAVAAVGIGAAVASGISSLAELEDATTSVDGAIKQMGLTGQLTSKQIADWANEIEANVGAAFDDKAITAAAATLIRYGKVSAKNLKPALVVMTDLAAKTGDVDSAATLLAKALADPEKAAGKLARQGIVLTKAEQDQIKAFMKAGKAAQAQEVILKSLERTTKGAAAASQGPYRRALATLADVAEDAKRALGEAFLPVLEKVAGILKKGLADPKVVANIREFGKNLASGLDSLISIAQKLPWGTIGDSLKIAGAGAKAVLGAFVSLPPWVQTAVLTGWGLNKLTGGALGGIIGELGKGLIHGVLGMTAGVVNLKAGVVTGLGTSPGAVGGAAGAAGAAGAGQIVTPIIGAAAIIPKESLEKLRIDTVEGWQALRTKLGYTTSAVGDVSKGIGFLVSEQIKANSDANAKAEAQKTAIGFVVNEQVRTKSAINTRVGDLIAATSASRAAVTARVGDMVAAAKGTTGAINAKDWSPTVNANVGVTTYVSVRSVVGAVTKAASYSHIGAGGFGKP